ncbi:MAG: hypothetical protein KDA38_13420 [Planctomycetales bacterium]|nr:hypothetical protein [Planctomycetales bacterium]
MNIEPLAIAASVTVQQPREATTMPSAAERAAIEEARYARISGQEQRLAAGVAEPRAETEVGDRGGGRDAWQQPETSVAQLGDFQRDTSPVITLEPFDPGQWIDLEL